VKRQLLFLFAIFLSGIGFSQGTPNWIWWCQNVNCTGNPEEHWVDFIEIAPGYMGPNALPVPEVSKGIIDNELRAEVGIQAHFGDGDDTQNLFTQ